MKSIFLQGTQRCGEDCGRKTNRKACQALKATFLNIDITRSKLHVAYVKGTMIQVAVGTVMRTAAE